MDQNPYEPPQHRSPVQPSLAGRLFARLLRELAEVGGCLVQLAGMFVLAIVILAAVIAVLLVLAPPDGGP
jgi:hypothetical protein